MRVLYLFCHPLKESYHGAILKEALAGLEEGRHEVDLLDLYEERFDPVLSAEGRRNYHDVKLNQRGLEDYVRRLRQAEALVLQFPTWTFGLPAMLKGFLDRLLMPGVAFDLSDPENVRSLLTNIRRITGISTYGRQRWVALYVGDPPRKAVTRYLPRLTAKGTRVRYHALYHMNVACETKRSAFLAQVRSAMAELK